MFDWFLNTPLNTRTIFFPYVSTLKLMTFWICFQRLTFPTNTCQRLRVFRTYNGAFPRFSLLCVCVCKIYKKTPVPESLFNKVTDRSPLSISFNFTKERTLTQMFSDEFCKVLQTPFLHNTSRQLLLYYRKNNLLMK